MKHTALTVIHEEHFALSAMLRSMMMLIDQNKKDGTTPPFDVLRAMLFYIDEFPERLHHTTETTLLFPLIREQVPHLGAVIDRLESDHHRGETSVRELGHRLLAYEVLGEPRRQAFEEGARRYVDAYLRHMALEESEILPAARQYLSPSQWAELDAAFAADADPLTGRAPPDEFKPLFRKIVMTAPAPIGLA